MGAAAGNEGFAALHLLHDPQVGFWVQLGAGVLDRGGAFPTGGGGSVKGVAWYAPRREAAAGNEGFAALHLLHDPQVAVCLGFRLKP